MDHEPSADGFSSLGWCIVLQVADALLKGPAMDCVGMYSRRLGMTVGDGEWETSHGRNARTRTRLGLRGTWPIALVCITSDG